MPLSTHDLDLLINALYLLALLLYLSTFASPFAISNIGRRRLLLAAFVTLGTGVVIAIGAAINWF
jgi:hypothetical protein